MFVKFKEFACLHSDMTVKWIFQLEFSWNISSHAKLPLNSTHSDVSALFLPFFDFDLRIEISFESGENKNKSKVY